MPREPYKLSRLENLTYTLFQSITEITKPSTFVKAFIVLCAIGRTETYVTVEASCDGNQCWISSCPKKTSNCLLKIDEAEDGLQCS